VANWGGKKEATTTQKKFRIQGDQGGKTKTLEKEVWMKKKGEGGQDRIEHSTNPVNKCNVVGGKKRKKKEGGTIEQFEIWSRGVSTK